MKATDNLRSEQDELLRQFEKSLQENFQKLMLDVKNNVADSDSEEELNDEEDILNAREDHDLSDAEEHLDSSDEEFEMPKRNLNAKEVAKKHNEQGSSALFDSSDESQNKSAGKMEVKKPSTAQKHQKNKNYGIDSSLSMSDSSNENEIVSKYSEKNLEIRKQPNVLAKPKAPEVNPSENKKGQSPLVKGVQKPIVTSQAKTNPVPSKPVVSGRSTSNPRHGGNNDKGLSKPSSLISKAPEFKVPSNTKVASLNSNSKFPPRKPSEMEDRPIVGRKNDQVVKITSSDNIMLSNNFSSVTKQLENNSIDIKNITKEGCFSKQDIPSEPALEKLDIRNFQSIPSEVKGQIEQRGNSKPPLARNTQAGRQTSMNAVRSQSFASNRNTGTRPMTSVERQKQPNIFSNSKLNTSLTQKSIKGSMVSVNSRNRDTRPNIAPQIDYKQKYEKMKQANKVLQEKFDALLKKHERLFQLFQKLESKLNSQKNKPAEISKIPTTSSTVQKNKKVVSSKTKAVK